MGRRRGAKSVGEVHPPTLLSTLCPTLPCDLVPRFSTGISLDLGICSPPRRPTEGVVEVRSYVSEPVVGDLIYQHLAVIGQKVPLDARITHATE